jgi:ADP-ribose pyrophosphatase YjhB (NUDIX family)
MDLHKFQYLILKNLAYNPALKFSDLQIEELTSKHFNYHLKRLVELGLVEKESALYKLTVKGKDFVNLLNDEKSEIEKQPKVSVLICVVEEVNGKKSYLMSKRLKHPYLAKIGNYTGKVRFGETFEEAAARELKEETGLQADFTLTKLYHKLAYNDKDQCVQDNIFVTFLAENISGDLTEKTEDTENIWLTHDELLQRKDELFNDVLPRFKDLQDEEFELIEDKIEAEGF